MGGCNRLWGIDVSCWQTDVDWKAFVGAGIDFAVVKLSDGMAQDTRFETHYNNAMNAGVPRVGVYHWFDPTVDWLRQAEFLLKLIDRYDPAFVAIDLEQYWTDDAIYFRVLRGELPASELQTIPPAHNNSRSQAFVDATKRSTDKNLLVYTAWWFVNSWCPQMKTWIGRENLWLAEYVRHTNNNHIMRTMDDFYRLVDSLPAQPGKNGIDCRPLMHQFSSSIIFPFHRSAVDTNVWCGTEDELNAFCSGVPVVAEPQPEPQPRGITERWRVRQWATPYVNVRETPAGRDLDDIYPGQVVDVVLDEPEIQRNGHTWVRVVYQRTGWVAKEYLERCDGR